MIVIIDYGSGNLRSAAKAFERMANGKKIIVSSDPKLLENASHIVLPGVGAFADCIKGLQNVSGMIAALEKQVLENKKPFLGICVGMQMLFEQSSEHGTHKGLGWLKGEVIKIDDKNGKLKIPHIGWNELNIIKPEHKLLCGINSGDHAYFVHSYHAINSDDVVATTDYGDNLTAIIARDNIMGTQFHPEKSQKTGLRLIENFVF